MELATSLVGNTVLFLLRYTQDELQLLITRLNRDSWLSARVMELRITSSSDGVVMLMQGFMQTLLSDLNSRASGHAFRYSCESSQDLEG